MRIDSHQHFWKFNERDYVWMTESMESLRRDFLPETLTPLLEEISFEGTIAVQARQKVEETDWLLALADCYPFIHGVVGWVDFESIDLGQQLARFSRHPKFKGVRELIHDMDDVNYAVSETHLRGIANLAPFDLTYDLLLKPQHIRPAVDLVSQFPDQRFVVDHLAKPDIARGARSPWREDLRALAEFDNVFCKLSGLVTEANWNKWLPGDLFPYLDIAVETFGPDRLMIGSDWPVCTLAGNYGDVMGVVIDYAARLSPSEQDDLLGKSCARFYQIMDRDTVATQNKGMTTS